MPKKIEEKSDISESEEIEDKSETSESEENEDSEIEDESDENQEIDDEVDEIDEDEKDEKDEESETEENPDDEESELDDEDLLQDLNDEEELEEDADEENINDNDENDMMDDGGDEDNIFEDKRKKQVKKVTTKKKLFPFMQKKKKKIASLQRNEKNYIESDIREIGLNFLYKLGKDDVNNKNLKSFIKNTLEPEIVNSVNRFFEQYSKDLDYTLDYDEDTTVFKKKYMYIIQYVLGFVLKNKTINWIENILDEIKSDKYCWESSIFAKESQIEQREIHKIKNPSLAAINCPDNPCPKCRCTLLFTTKKQLRGGDEGESKLFTCEQCDYSWRRNG